MAGQSQIFLMDKARLAVRTIRWCWRKYVTTTLCVAPGMSKGQAGFPRTLTSYVAATTTTVDDNLRQNCVAWRIIQGGLPADLYLLRGRNHDNPSLRTQAHRIPWLIQLQNLWCSEKRKCGDRRNEGWRGSLTHSGSCRVCNKLRAVENATG
ncbi:hypothetical protein L218DRAFT_961634 [Marasmius fiardii PR-910]|nr:hypothetical protein L218DRAFT_961634 [Marasmius fiardii PR-910]